MKTHFRAGSESALHVRALLDAREAETSGLKESVVLFFPACDSFDQYPNFEVRGDAFRELVRKL